MSDRDHVTTRLSRGDVLCLIDKTAYQALDDTRGRLREREYFLHGGLIVTVEITARSLDGQKVGKFYKVGDAMRLYQWEGEA